MHAPIKKFQLGTCSPIPQPAPPSPPLLGSMASAKWFFVFYNWISLIPYSLKSDCNSSSSSSESDENVSIARLKPPTRRQIEESSNDDEDDIPLSLSGKKARQSILSSQSSHNEEKEEDQEEEEEEGGELSDTGEPWGGVVEEDILPPQSQVGLGWWQNC